jgi:hypothetical protein
MSDIIGFEACKNELQRLLAEVRENINKARAQGPDALHAAVLSETERLVEFTSRTEPKDRSDTAEIENIRQIDLLADEARHGIFGESADEIIARIQDRASQLNQLAKSVKQQAENNARRAKELRLEPLRKVIDALTETVQAFKAAKNELLDQEADEAAVKSRIDSVVRAITELERAVRDIGA